MLLMGIDCGTQGLKAILWDSEKNRSIYPWHVDHR